MLTGAGFVLAPFLTLFLFPCYRRGLQLLASGLFLPGSLGIIDPCEVKDFDGTLHLLHPVLFLVTLKLSQPGLLYFLGLVAPR